MPGKVRVRDRGANKVVKRIKDANFLIKVGVLGSEQHDGSATTIAELAEIHEFGLGVPERSFIRAWADRNRADVQRDMRAAHRQMVRGRLTAKQAANILGARFAGQIQEFIANGEVKPPLSPVTVARKGSSLALVDTGQLRSAITFAVESVLTGTPR